jgi:hypothetical protein
MSIVGGFDVHRQQITFDYLDTETGQLCRGQVRPATRVVLRGWLAQRFAGRADVAFAVEGCTGWRFIAEELARAGVPGRSWLASYAPATSRAGPGGGRADAAAGPGQRPLGLPQNRGGVPQARRDSVRDVGAHHPAPAPPRPGTPPQRSQLEPVSPQPSCWNPRV